jgi:glucose/arabinose dehydrogenase
VLEENTHKTRLVPYASGLRNPVGFDWDPQSGVMYAGNNGPDHQGFELPPEYFSRIETGSFHGMPWYQFNGQTIRRDSCIRRQAPKPVTTVPGPVATFPARNAPMGVSFIPAKAMDHRFIFDAVVALRGSWATLTKGNSVADQATRRPPKLVVVRFDDGRAQGVDDLVTGFQLDNGKRWARPVGVAIGPDGDLYFTSDSGINGLFRLRRLTAR